VKQGRTLESGALITAYANANDVSMFSIAGFVGTQRNRAVFDCDCTLIYRQVGGALRRAGIQPHQGQGEALPRLRVSENIVLSCAVGAEGVFGCDRVCVRNCRETEWGCYASQSGIVSVITVVTAKYVCWFDVRVYRTKVGVRARMVLDDAATLRVVVL
jgi:hypothetical protein